MKTHQTAVKNVLKAIEDLTVNTKLTQFQNDSLDHEAMRKLTDNLKTLHLKDDNFKAGLLI